jgi:Bacterial regulatory helix-turn-helix protein, lysR family
MNRRVDRWTQIELFVLTAELGSLSKAAEQRDMSNAAASRALSADYGSLVPFAILHIAPSVR